MTSEKLCNDGRCKRIRMGEEKHESHESNKKRRQWLIPEKAIKNMKKITITFVILAFALGFLVQIVFDPPSFLTERGVTPLFSQWDGGVPLDLLNITTLVMEIIFGIFITLVVYVYSKRQQEQNKETIDKMNDSVLEVQDIIKEQKKLQEVKKAIGEKRLGIYLEIFSSLIENKENYLKYYIHEKDLETNITDENKTIKEYLQSLDRIIDNYSDVLEPFDARKCEILSVLLNEYSNSISATREFLLSNINRHMDDLRKKYPASELNDFASSLSDEKDSKTNP